MRKTLAALVAVVMIAGTFPTAALAAPLPEVPHGDRLTENPSGTRPRLPVKKQQRPLSLPGGAANSLAGGNAPALAPGQRGLFVVQFNSPITDNSRAALRAVGADLGPYLGGPALIARMTPEAAAKLAQDDLVASVDRYQSDWKVSPDLKQGKGAANVRVVTFPGAGSATASGLKTMGARPVQAGSNQFVLSQADPKKVSQVAGLEEVLLVEEAKEPKLFNDVARGIMRVSGSGSPWSYGLTGQGQIVGIADTGLDTGDLATLHPDLKNRIAGVSALGRANDWSDPHGHGTHVAGSVVGDGTASAGKYKGVAPGAKTYFQSILMEDGGLYIPNDDVSTLLDQAYQNGARIHSDSWGASQPGGKTPYDSWAAQVDTYTWSHRDYTVLFAAGNEGTPGEVTSEGYWTIGTPGNAKNAITIGATESVRPEVHDSWGDNANDLAPFSSKGPTHDGRIKPDLVAPGTWILSTRSSVLGAEYWDVKDDRYAYMGGTSMATPLSAGAAAIVRQYYTDKKKVASPSSALIKATLINGARDTGYGWASEEQGWGRIDLTNSLYPTGRTNWFKDEGKPIRYDDIHAYEFNVRSGDLFKASLVWNDYPGMPNGGYALMNDLDLYVEGPDGTWYVGNCFVNNTAGTADDPSCFGDAVNNVEGIYIQAPTTGTYRVYVFGYDVPTGTQPYALVVSGKSLTYVADTTKPNLTVNGLSSGYVPTSVTVTADAEDDGIGMDRVEYLVNGQSQYTSYVSPYPWVWDTTGLTGAQTVTVKAYDLNGNVNSQTYTVTIDREPPVINSVTPGDGGYVGISANVSVTATDNGQIDKVEFTLDDAEEVTYTADAAPWAYAWDASAEANDTAHKVKVVVYDKAGWTATQTINVKVDSERPAVNLATPANGALLPDGTYDLRVGLSDNNGVARVDYYVNGVKKGAGNPDDDFAWQWNTAGLPSGTYTLKATARDVAGNAQDSAPVSVTLDTVKPTLSWGTGTPATGAALKGTVALSATTDASKLEFYDGETLLATITTAPYSYDWDTVAGAVADGPHTLWARAYDTAGNLSELSLAVTVDNTLPAISLPDVPADGKMRPGFLVTADVSDNVAVAKVDFLVDGTVKMTRTKAPYTYTLPSLAGPHTLQARVTDTAGNVNQTDVLDISVDGKGPSGVSLTGLASGKVYGDTVSVTVKATDNLEFGRVEFWLDKENVTELFTVPPQAPGFLAFSITEQWTYNFDTTKVPDGSHSLQAVVYDAHGNSAKSAMINFKVDNTAPAVEGITPVGGAVKGKATVTALVKDAIGVNQVEFYLGDALTPTATDKSAPYSFTIDTTQLANGPLALKVKAYDLAGHTTAQDYTLQIDNEKPEVILTTISEAVLKATTVEVTATATDEQGAIRYVEFYVDNAKKYTAQEAGESGAFSWSWNTATVRSGTHTVMVKAYDLAGNVSTPASFKVTVDTLKPTVSIISPAANAFVTGPVEVKATASDNNKTVTAVEFYLDGALQESALVGKYYVWNWNSDTAEAGLHTVTVKAYDPAGNVGVTERTFKIDKTQPDSPSFLNLTADQLVKPGYKVEIGTGDDTGVVKAEYYIDGIRMSTVTRAPFSWNLSSTVKAGPHTIRVVVTDGVGRQNETSVNVTVDRTAPKLTVTGLNATVAGEVTVQALATDETAVAKVEVYLGSEKLETVEGDTLTWTWDTTALTNGYKTLKFVAYDTAGNTTTYTRRVRVAN